MVYLGPLSESTLAQCADLERQATVCKQAKDWDGAIALLKEVKALHGDIYQSTRLAKFLQHGGYLKEALQEIEWLATHSKDWAQAMFGHQPAAVKRQQQVGWKARVYADAILIAKRAKRDDIQQRYEAKREACLEKKETNAAKANAARAKRNQDWEKAKAGGREAMQAFLRSRTKN